jgi:hypothetical protein
MVEPMQFLKCCELLLDTLAQFLALLYNNARRAVPMRLT